MFPVKFQYQTSSHPCVDNPATGAAGCGAQAHQPCVIRSGGYNERHVGQPRATLHAHRRRDEPASPLARAARELLDLGPSVTAPPPEMVRELTMLKAEVAAAKGGQPAPVANEHPPIVPQVIADLEARMALGKQRYGVALQPFNGRNALQDAYEEALDLAIYLRQAIEEQNSMGQRDRLREA